MEKRKGIVRIQEGDITLYMDLYEGRDGEFFVACSKIKGDQLIDFRIHPGEWVPFEKDREMAHLAALYEETTRRADKEV